MSRKLSSTAAIVGVGNTRYGLDYAERGVERQALDLATEAFAEAIEDCGLTPESIDGLAINSLIPASRGLTFEAFSQRVGIKPARTYDGYSIGTLAEAIASGECSTIALVYGTAQRSQSVAYGGAEGRRSYLNYFYYFPWGFSSQAAHWALMFRRHQVLYGSTEEQLGTVAVTLRKHAMMNPDAVMRQPITVEDYMDSRYICRPLRLLDLCLVNDGGVAIILSRGDMATGLRKIPIKVSGFGHAEGIGTAQLRPVVLDLFRDTLHRATTDALQMAGITLGDIGHFQAYDASSANIPIALEAIGFCPPGEALNFIQDGRIEVGGQLPCNTSGGLLSESYMHGHNHTVEAVRQLRHEAGSRQVVGVEASMNASTTTGTAGCVVYQRGL